MKKIVLFFMLFSQISYSQILVQHGDSLTIPSLNNDLSSYQMSLNIYKSTFLSLPDPQFQDLFHLLALLNSKKIYEHSSLFSTFFSVPPRNYLKALMSCIYALNDVNERLIKYFHGEDVS
ncbi:MAG: hypothetical protein LBK92_02755 [Endomicrobium sp.]|nr:hypothetical protein [Endomicrobium sp.]